jgi:hypothetical protein
MATSRRTIPPDDVRARQGAAIAEFWAWWSTSGAERAAGLFDGGGQPDELTALAQEVGTRVQAIAPLAFETGPGRSARHMLVVSPAGDPELREVAERWLAAAPQPDAAFEYATWRQPVPDAEQLVVEYGEWPVALGEAAVVVVEGGGRAHVEVSHPRFVQMPDEDRGQLTFLFLDALLGERAVEELIGAVAWASTREPAAIPFTELAEVVERLRG